MASQKKNYVSIPEWMVTNHLIEADSSKEGVRAAVAWFKRNLDVLTVLSPKAGVYLTDETAANAALVEYYKLMPEIQIIKQRAALKLCAKNVGMSIAKRANIMPDEPTKAQRDEFWNTPTGKPLFEYQTIRLYTEKPELIPLDSDLTPPTDVQPALLEVLRPHEVIDDALLKATISKIGKKKVGSKKTTLRATRTISAAEARDRDSFAGNGNGNGHTEEPPAEGGDDTNPEEPRPPAAGRKKGGTT
jgi:hypothetical protein